MHVASCVVTTCTMHILCMHTVFGPGLWLTVLLHRLGFCFAHIGYGYRCIEAVKCIYNSVGHSSVETEELSVKELVKRLSLVTVGN